MLLIQREVRGRVVVQRMGLGRIVKVQYDTWMRARIQYDVYVRMQAGVPIYQYTVVRRLDLDLRLRVEGSGRSLVSQLHTKRDAEGRSSYVVGYLRVCARPCDGPKVEGALRVAGGTAASLTGLSLNANRS